MFKCVSCGQVSTAGEKAVMVVLESAQIEHAESFNKKKQVKSSGGIGTRIVREGQMHASCAAAFRPTESVADSGFNPVMTAEVGGL